MVAICNALDNLCRDAHRNNPKIIICPERHRLFLQDYLNLTVGGLSGIAVIVRKEVGKSCAKKNGLESQRLVSLRCCACLHQAHYP